MFRNFLNWGPKGGVLIFVEWSQNDYLELQASPKQNCQKKLKLILASVGEAELPYDSFFEILIGPLEVVEVGLRF